MSEFSEMLERANAATELGDRLSLFRESRKYTQKAVAEYMRGELGKWSQATVWAVEKGERQLRLEEAHVLANLYGVSLYDFLGAQPSDYQDAFGAGYALAVQDAKGLIAKLVMPHE